jgi:hypothetical protein
MAFSPVGNAREISCSTHALPHSPACELRRFATQLPRTSQSSLLITRPFSHPNNLLAEVNTSHHGCFRNSTYLRHNPGAR